MNVHQALIVTFTVSLTDSKPGYVRKQTKGACVTEDTDPKTTQWLIWSSTKKVLLLRITQRSEERGGGHLMPLMSKLGARVSSGLQKRENMEILFVLSLKGANDEMPLSCRERESAQMWSGTSHVSCRAGEERLQIIHLHHQPDLDNHFNA